MARVGWVVKVEGEGEGEGEREGVWGGGLGFDGRGGGEERFGVSCVEV